MKTALRIAGRMLRTVDRALEVLFFDVLFKRGRRALVLGAAVLAAGWMLVLGGASAPAGGEDEWGPEHKDRLLIDRPWLDHLPKDEHDVYKALIFHKKKVGAALKASAYRGQWELFLFRQKGKQLEMLFPHDKRRAVTDYSISKIKHRTFDLELRLDDSPVGPKTFYSWKKRPHAEAIEAPLRSMALERWLLPVSEAIEETEWPED